MAAKFVSEGKVLKYTATSDIKRGDVVVINSLLVTIALEDIATGETGAVAVTGIFEAPKAAVAVSQGAKLYWNATAGNFTTSSSGTIFAGYAAEAAGDNNATVRILLHPLGS